MVDDSICVHRSRADDPYASLIIHISVGLLRRHCHRRRIYSNVLIETDVTISFLCSSYSLTFSEGQYATIDSDSRCDQGQRRSAVFICNAHPIDSS
ncbi:unnamed protein product [Caenorhabditis nigoni]